MQEDLPTECPDAIPPYPTIVQSPELSVFLEKLPVIRNGIFNSIQHGIAPRAYACGLTCQESHRAIMDSHSNLTADMRTDIFLNDLESRIRIDAASLTTFIEVLTQSDAAYHAPLTKIIGKTTWCMQTRSSIETVLGFPNDVFSVCLLSAFMCLCLPLIQPKLFILQELLYIHLLHILHQ